MERRREAVAGPTPVNSVAAFRAFCSGAGKDFVVLDVDFEFGFTEAESSSLKARAVVVCTSEASLRRIRAGRKGRFVPWVLRWVR